MAKIKEGDLFYISDYKNNEGIELKLSKNRIGKLIFVSRLFKRMIAFVVSVEGYDEIPNDLSKVEFNNDVIYAWDLLFRIDVWKIIGNQKVTDDEIRLTTRLVGNALMCLDEELELISQDERGKYKKQLINGEILVYKIINEHLS